MTTNTNNTQMTPSQQQALRMIEQRLGAERFLAGHKVEVTIDVQGTDYGPVWIRVEQDMPTLEQGNMLRVLESMDRWFILCTPRGKLVAKTYPRSIEQFAGSKWCGIHIERE